MVSLWLAALSAAQAEPLTQDDATEPAGLVAPADAEADAAYDDWAESRDPAEAAEHEAHEAVLQLQATHDRHSATLQTFLGRPPTWIQSSSRVNLAEFPTHADPTDAADRQLRTLEWLLEDRQRQAAIAAAKGPANQGAGIATEEARWLDAVLPSSWLPVVREHRDTLLVSGVVLLCLSWLFQTLLRRATRKSWRWRRSRLRGGRGARTRSAPMAAVMSLQQTAGATAGQAPQDALRSKRDGRRRRRRRSSSSASAAAPSGSWWGGKPTTRS